MVQRRFSASGEAGEEIVMQPFYETLAAIGFALASS
jgi:hypothetical protein